MEKGRVKKMQKVRFLFQSAQNPHKKGTTHPSDALPYSSSDVNYFTSHVSFVIKSSWKLWYFFLLLTSSICSSTASL